MTKISPLSGIVTSIKASKCLQNIENMKIKLPNNKFCTLSSISEKEARNLVKEFGYECSYSGLPLPKYDANYYELPLQTADAITKAKIKINAEGNVVKSLQREEETASGHINKQYAVEMYTKNEHITENCNNGTTYRCIQNAQGDVLEMSEKSADGHLYKLTRQPNGDIKTKGTNSFNEFLRSGIKSFAVKENSQGKILTLEEEKIFDKTVLEAADN